LWPAEPARQNPAVTLHPPAEARPGVDPIRSLLTPSSVAVVGASPSSFVGRILLENLRTLGFAGPVYPVNPRYDEILGYRCYPSLEAVPEPPEAVAVALRIDLVPGVLRTAGEIGARAAVVPGGGFSETGDAALLAQDEIGEVAAEFGMAVAGPNCMGVLAPGRNAGLYIGTVPASLLAGHVALVSQSGSVIEAAANMGPRVGFSALVSCGVEAATTAGDYFRFFAEDDRTVAVAAFLEGFRDPRSFVAGARALREAGKPLVVCKVGRTEEAQAAIAAHSGTLAGSDVVVTGLLAQLGAIRVDDLDELLEISELLGHGRRPRGRRMMVITDSGGEANLVADHMRWFGLEAPPPSERLQRRLRERWPHFAYIGNPIDPWGVDPDYGTLYPEILAAMSEEDVDILAVALDKVTPWAGPMEVDLGVAAGRGLIGAVQPPADGERSSGQKFAAFLTVNATGPAERSVRDLLRDANVPLMHGLRPALLAIARAAWWQAWRPRTPAARVKPGDRAAAARSAIDAFAGDGPILSERASRRVLAAYGVPLSPGRAVATAEEAGDAARHLGFPVVMKGDVAGVAHKAAAGLVATGVASEEQARRTFRTLVERAREAGAEPRGALVEATASGVELICGMRRDPVFGPVVLLGVGGTLTEILNDVAVRVAPPSPEDLEEMLAGCSAGRLLSSSGADPTQLFAALQGLSDLAEDLPEVQEVDVNPLFVATDGTAAAADALVVVERSDGGSES